MTDISFSDLFPISLRKLVSASILIFAIYSYNVKVYPSPSTKVELVCQEGLKDCSHLINLGDSSYAVCSNSLYRIEHIKKTFEKIYSSDETIIGLNSVAEFPFYNRKYAISLIVVDQHGIKSIKTLKLGKYTFKATLESTVLSKETTNFVQAKKQILSLSQDSNFLWNGYNMFLTKGKNTFSIDSNIGYVSWNPSNELLAYTKGSLLKLFSVAKNETVANLTATSAPTWIDFYKNNIWASNGNEIWSAKLVYPKKYKVGLVESTLRSMVVKIGTVSKVGIAILSNDQAMLCANQ
eukprot:NODE_128_length_17019_cov_0.764480.p6 type:complete len:294 gc:universal NODE_128_length_17019_cov_0.764480:4074-3193(-)